MQVRYGRVEEQLQLKLEADRIQQQPVAGRRRREAVLRYIRYELGFQCFSTYS